jgi:hypothetical protein
MNVDHASIRKGTLSEGATLAADLLLSVIAGMR